MTDRVDLEALNHVIEVAEFLGEPIKMTPAQLRTLLHEMTASRAVEQGMVAQLEEVRDGVVKASARLIELTDENRNLRAENAELRDTIPTGTMEMLDRVHSAERMANDAYVALERITDEFGDYEGLRQSREICDDRIAKLRNVRALHAEFTSERYAWDHLHNAAFGAVVTILGNVLDGAPFDPDLARLMDLATKCMHENWVYQYVASHPDGSVQACGACGAYRDEVPKAEDNGSNAMTRKAWMKKVGLTE